MKILVACEESQRVTMEFRKLGHNAYSCDIIDCSGGHPEWHIKGDALRLINGNCSFTTDDGIRHILNDRWDMLIAFPPCTYLTNSGNKWFNVNRFGDKAIQRWKNREDAAEFFMEFVNADCERIIIENPVGIMSRWYKKPSQIINPYQFGDPYAKKTCLWIKGVDNLIPTNVVPKEFVRRTTGEGNWFDDVPSGMKRATWRSKTFPGVALAMATQWGDVIN